MNHFILNTDLNKMIIGRKCHQFYAAATSFISNAKVQMANIECNGVQCFRRTAIHALSIQNFNSTEEQFAPLSRAGSAAPKGARGIAVPPAPFVPRKTN